MFKKLSALLSVLLVLCMVFCMAGCDKGDVNSTPDNSQPTSTPEKDTTSTDSDTSSDLTSSEDKKEDKEDKEESNPSTPSKPAGPTVVNPKTNIKLDKYYAGEFLSTDGKTYTRLQFAFHDGGEWGYSYDYSASPYFNKERCIEIYQGWGSEFDEADFEENQIVTIKGVKYYYIDGYGGGTAHSCDFTDNAIILSDDEKEIATLSLLSDGTLVVKSIKSEKYGAVGTVFTLKNE